MGVGGLKRVQERESLQFCHLGGEGGKPLHKRWVNVVHGRKWCVCSDTEEEVFNIVLEFNI